MLKSWLLRRKTSQQSVRPWLEVLEDRLVPTPGGPGTITVNSAADSGTGTLRAAIIQAETDSAGDTINFNSATMSGQTITLASPLPALTNGETISGLGSNSLTVNASGTGSIFNTSGSQSISISGLTLTGGSANDGGAIFNTGALQLTNLVITGNNNGTGNNAGGGAIYNSGGTIDLTNSSLTNNTTGNGTQDAGGAILNVTGTLQLTSDVLTGNTTGNGNGDVGGAIDSINGTLQVANSTITGSTTGSGFGNGGGAIYASGGTVQLTDDEISGNTTGGGGSGGGIFTTNATMTVIGSTISGNAAAGGSGGGISTLGGNGLTLLNTTIVNNNTEAAGLTAPPGQGGGVYFSGGVLTVNDCTIAGNTDESSGGANGILAGTTTFVLNNTIVAGTTAASNSILDAFGRVTSGQGNFIGVNLTSGGLTGISNGNNGNQIGTPAAPLNAALGQLQNNGGPTLTQLPMAGSPVINKGVSSVIPTGTTTDQRGTGFIRIVGSSVDVGAVEYQPPGTNTGLIASPNPVTFGQTTTLTATVTPLSPGPNNAVTEQVTFFQGSSNLGAVQLNASGVATISITPPTAGMVSYSAVYSGDDNYTTSTGLLSVQVNQAPTSIALTDSPATIAYGTSTELIATVANTTDAPASFTGIVTFFSGANSVGTADVANGGATFIFTPAAAGSLSLTASYSNDPNFASSSSSPGVPLQVNPLGTQTTLGASATNVILGQSVTLTATVGVGGGVFFKSPPVVMGSVTFFNGATEIGSAPLNSSGVATISFTPTTSGTLDLGAQFAGNNDFTSSTAGSVALQVESPQQTVGVYDPSTATWYLRNSNSSGAPSIAPFQYGGPGWVPLVGNWTGSGQDTIAVIDPSTETWYIRFSNTPGAPSITPFQYGAPGWLPLAGDWTDSGQDGIAVVDTTTATWYIKNTPGSGAPSIAPFQFGEPGWIPVAGDWTGDGHDGIGMFDPTTGMWYLKNSATPGAADIIFQYGMVGGYPVVGDFAGNGKTTVAVIDPTASWYIRFSNSPGAPNITRFQYGETLWSAFAGMWQAPATGQAEYVDYTGPGAPALSNRTLQVVVAQALGRLSNLGINTNLLDRLASANYEVTTLSGDMLAETFVSTDTVEIDATADGRGWFTDASTGSDAEYVNGRALPNTPAGQGIDLLTTVLHEMAHLAGMPDLAPAQAGNGLMNDVLGQGQRRVQDLDQVFALGFSATRL